MRGVSVGGIAEDLAEDKEEGADEYGEHLVEGVGVGGEEVSVEEEEHDDGAVDEEEVAGEAEGRVALAGEVAGHEGHYGVEQALSKYHEDWDKYG